MTDAGMCYQTPTLQFINLLGEQLGTWNEISAECYVTTLNIEVLAHANYRKTGLQHHSLVGWLLTDLSKSGGMGLFSSHIWHNVHAAPWIGAQLWPNFPSCNLNLVLDLKRIVPRSSQCKNSEWCGRKSSQWEARESACCCRLFASDWNMTSRYTESLQWIPSQEVVKLAKIPRSH